MSESFAELFENSVENNVKTGSIIMGTIIDIGRDRVVISVGLKSEGFVPISQFKNANGELEIATGDVIEVALDAEDDGLGHTLLSREKAKRIKIWQELKVAMDSKETIKGIVTDKVKGGLIVDIGVVKAFLPGSLIDVYPVKDFGFLEGQEIEALVIKMDELRNNIVISRRGVLEQANSVGREELINSLEVGGVVEGMVKNLAHYGAFIDLGGVDGLLHITDISWKRVNHPSEELTIGTKIKVKVLNVEKETARISLGLKQLNPSPWDNLSERLPIGKRITGFVSNLTDYGAFVTIEDGIEGLVHMSELDWTNRNARPSKFVKLGQEVSVVILDVDSNKCRISLSLKQAKENPWDAFEASYNNGDKIKGLIKSITDFGLFIGLPGGIDGLVHLADISWANKGEDVISNYSKGQELEVAIINIDSEKERISLGLKQLKEDAFSQYINKNNKGVIVKGKISKIEDNGAVVELAPEINAYLKISEISQERVEIVSNALTLGDEIEAVITQIDKRSRNILISIKQKDKYENDANLIDYNAKTEATKTSSTLGDMLRGAK